MANELSYKKASRFMRAFFKNRWVELSGEAITPVSYPSLPFSKPDNFASYLRMTVQHALGYQASIGDPGNNRFRRDGLITFQVFTKESDEGDLATRDLVDEVVNLYIKNSQADGITYYNVKAKEIGADGFGYEQWNVYIDFKYDNIT